jgi:hypothetical protein
MKKQPFLVLPDQIRIQGGIYEDTNSIYINYLR